MRHRELYIHKHDLFKSYYNRVSVLLPNIFETENIKFVSSIMLFNTRTLKLI